MAVSLLDWTISYGPLTIGDAETLPAVNFTNFDPLTMPDIRTNDVTLIQRDGLWAGDDYMGGRTIALSLEVQALTPDEFNSSVNLIMRAFSPGVDGETPLTFQIPGLCNGRAASINARTRKRSAPLDASFARLSCAFEIELFATDPVITAVDTTSITLKKGVTSRISVDGTRSITPHLATGVKVTDPKLTNAVTGDVHNITGSGTFTIPVAQRPSFTPGDHYLTMTDSGTDPTGQVWLTMRDEWI
ncbi:hypothetical protein [Streptomyces sp. NPDC048142]|uniref:hypothetical protein n=1 Tax=Streptomyces sp. NPDC048142 TaxID=3365501 RepID=UPI00371254C1